MHLKDPLPIWLQASFGLKQILTLTQWNQDKFCSEKYSHTLGKLGPGRDTPRQGVHRKDDVLVTSQIVTHLRFLRVLKKESLIPVVEGIFV